MNEIRMPKLSDTMEEGKLLRWRKAVGDSVAIGEVLAEVETDKADMELESSVAGTLRSLDLAEGDTAPVGAVIARVEGSAAVGERAPAIEALPPAEPARAPEPATPARRAAPTEAAGRPESPGGAVGKAGAAVAAGKVPPSGSRVSRSSDARPGPPGVVRVKPPPPVGSSARPAVAETVGLRVRRVPLSRMRSSIARRMAESHREAPHFYLTLVVAMDEAVRLRAALAQILPSDQAVTYNHMVLKACADALVVHPAMNARFAGDSIELIEDVNLGVAMAVSDGLIVPVIHGANEIPLQELAVRARALAERARTDSFGTGDLAGATFSVSNLGMYGVESFAAVINPPQAGILAVGSVELRPVVREGALAIGHTMSLTLSCDHRAIDGAAAAPFLADVKRRLENPISLVVVSPPSE